MSKSGLLLTKTEEPCHLGVGKGTDNGRAETKWQLRTGGMEHRHRPQRRR